MPDRPTRSIHIRDRVGRGPRGRIHQAAGHRGANPRLNRRPGDKRVKKPRNMPKIVSGEQMGSLDCPDVLRLAYVDMGTDNVPESETQLWRFMDLAKLVSILDHQALYFPVVAALGDKLEGALPRVPPGATPLDKRDAWHVRCFNRAVTFVNCWHMSPVESDAMWAVYAHQGVAVQTSFDRLSKAINQRPAAHPPDPDQTVVGGKVTYVDPNEEAEVGYVWANVTEVRRKRRWYEYEQEVRLVYTRFSNYPAPPYGSALELGTPKLMGVWVSCDLAQAISAIVVAPHTPRYLEESVRAVVKRFCLDPSIVRRSRIEEGAPRPPDPSEIAEYLKTPPPPPSPPEPDSGGLS